MKKTLIAVLTGIGAMLISSVSSDAKVVLPHVFGDNMVLQQQTSAKIWGTADPNSTVIVTPSWGGTAVTAQADADGRWCASVATPKAGGPYTLTVSDGEELVLSNVLIGEVWVCSGQSNMEMPMKGFNNQPAEGAADLIIGAKACTPIRMITFPRVAAFTPQDDIDAEWKENVPEAVADASATAYYFAHYIQSVLDVPVGIIIDSWGGSSMESWMDRETVAAGFPELDMAYLDTQEMPKNPNNHSALLYNGMLHPVIGYTMRGMIWYQGEANRNKPEQYLRLQQSFVQMMRDQWGVGEFPFYYVQIAPYVYEGAEGDISARLRESQMKALDLIPNSGMAVTLDIGDCGCIHPAKKAQVGQRLAFLALTQTYGYKGIDPYAPIYDSWEFADGKITVSFKVGPLGLAPLGHVLDGFEVAGADREFHPATAKILGKNRIEVFCPEVTEPAAVRYGFHNCTGASLFNNFGIPASSFRTDEW
ncbi:MAG: sialate O-acetylesterase [Bacteroidales bacterium]|nr:sialate O-acetylesterase [Bacteroidales bacterium]